MPMPTAPRRHYWLLALLVGSAALLLALSVAARPAIPLAPTAPAPPLAPTPPPPRVPGLPTPRPRPDRANKGSGIRNQGSGPLDPKSQIVNPQSAIQNPDSWHTVDVQDVRPAWAAGVRGDGVTVAVIDSGVDF